MVGPKTPHLGLRKPLWLCGFTGRRERSLDLLRDRHRPVINRRRVLLGHRQMMDWS